MNEKAISAWVVPDSILCAAALILLIIHREGNLEAIISVAVLAANAATVLKARHNWLLLIISVILLYCNYSICAANYLFTPLESYFTGYAETEIGSSGLCILLFFSVCLMLIMPVTPKIKTQVASLLVNNRYCFTAVVGIAAVLVLVWTYGFRRPEIAGERGSPSAIYEYSIVLIIVALYFSGKNRILQAAIVAIAVCYALQNFVYGGRITGIQIAIVLVVGLFIDRLSMAFTVPAGAVFFVLMTSIGMARSNASDSAAGFSAVVHSLISKRFALDTAYSAYFTSMTFLDELTASTVHQRIGLFLRWILSLFLGGSVQDSNLPLYTRQHFLHYGGGVLPYYAWYYLGVIGIFLLVLLLRFWFKLISKNSGDSSGLVRCLSVYICSTALRWYLYSPSQLTRGAMLLCLVYGFARLIDSLGRVKV